MYRRRVLAGVAGLFLPPALTGCARHDNPPRSGPSMTSAPAPSSDGKATAADYAALVSSGILGEVYALTWARGLSREAMAKRFKARRILGTFSWPEANWSDLPGVRTNEAVVGITEIRDWALAVEEVPLYSENDALINRLSQGSRVVSNYHSFEADDRFVLADDGTIQLDFDPRTPTMRTGARPGMLLADMRAAGLDLSGTYPDPADPAYRDIPYAAAALALTQRVTGVRLSAGLLHTSTYLAATVPGLDPGSALNEVPEVARAGPS